MLGPAVAWEGPQLTLGCTKGWGTLVQTVEHQVFLWLNSSEDEYSIAQADAIAITPWHNDQSLPVCFRILSAKGELTEFGMEELNSWLVTDAQSQKFHNILSQG